MRGRAWVACSFIPNPSVTSGAPTRVLFSFFFMEFGPVMPGLDPVLFFTPWQIFILLVIVIRLSGICSISSETFILLLPHFSLCLSVLLWVSWSSLPEEILHWIPDILCSCGNYSLIFLPLSSICSEKTQIWTHRAILVSTLAKTNLSPLWQKSASVQWTDTRLRFS